MALFHRFFRRSRCVTATVRTNADGLFELGQLSGVTSVRVKPANSTLFAEKTLNLLADV